MSTSIGLSKLPPLTKLILTTNGITGVSFASLQYENANHEQQKVLVNIGVSYESVKTKDIHTLETLNLVELINDKFDLSILTIARDELLESIKTPNENKSKGQIDAYTHINHGLKFHNETGEIYIFGMLVNKTVTKEGVYKEVKSSEKTLAKNYIRKLLKTTQYRQYKVDMTSVAKLKGETIEFVV
jgi:hypothetical protein